MAQIYLARQSGLGSFERHVVLKTILRERATDQRFVTMFLDEAKLAATLNHQNVAQVYEVDQADGAYFMAMEYVHGENARAILETTLRRGWTIPLELAVMIIGGAAAGLHHAHERHGKNGQPLNIVHRDVSPANIMVGYDGSVKVLDFGIAKAEERATKTVGGTIKGKYGYMSPEQCKGKLIDRRSDIFALGICLYELTTLRRAFKGNDDFETMKRIVSGDLVPPSVALPGYPRELEAIVLTAMAQDPAQRFQNAQEMIEALDTFAQRAKLTGSNTAMGRFMVQLFGSKREPWVDGAVGEQQPENTQPGMEAMPEVPDVSDVPPPGQFDDDDDDEKTSLVDLSQMRQSQPRMAVPSPSAPAPIAAPPSPPSVAVDPSAWQSNDVGPPAKRTSGRIPVAPSVPPPTAKATTTLAGTPMVPAGARTPPPERRASNPSIPAPPPPMPQQPPPPPLGMQPPPAMTTPPPFMQPPEMQQHMMAMQQQQPPPGYPMPPPQQGYPMQQPMPYPMQPGMPMPMPMQGYPMMGSPTPSPDDDPLAQMDLPTPFANQPHPHYAQQPPPYGYPNMAPPAPMPPQGNYLPQQDFPPPPDLPSAQDYLALAQSPGGGDAPYNPLLAQAAPLPSPQPLAIPSPPSISVPPPDDFHSTTPVGSKSLLGDNLGWDTKIAAPAYNPAAVRAGATRLQSETAHLDDSGGGNKKWIIVIAAAVVVLAGTFVVLWRFVL
jgi:serine/threonine-protein kinase